MHGCPDNYPLHHSGQLRKVVKTVILENVVIAFFISLNDVGDLREEIEGSIHTEQEPEVWNSSVLVSATSL